MSQPAGSCLIVGGGLSGLTAATTLQQQGIQVTVVDKGYGIGGRLASRSVAAPSGEKGLFDYGAQYFPLSTASDSRFRDWLNQRVNHGIMQQWSDRFPSVQPAPSSPQQPATASLPKDAPSTRFFRGSLSNRHVAQDLAAGLDVRNQTRIETLKWHAAPGQDSGQDSGQWEAISTNGTSFQSDAVILTSPVPQTLQILADSGIPLTPAQQQRLEQVSYSRTIAVLAILEQECPMRSPGGLSIESNEIMWIASNSIKGISPLPSVTIHATPELSEQLWDVDKADMARQILDAAAPWLGSPVLAYHVHRWGYSQPTALYGEAIAVLTPSSSNPAAAQTEELSIALSTGLSGQLVLAGDAFGSALGNSPSGQSHIERAWLSGLTAAEYLCRL